MKFLKQDKFNFSYNDFPRGIRCEIQSGPVSIKMLRGQMGKEWVVKRDVYCFKVTIENGHPNTLDEALDAVSRLPLFYMVGLEIVSGESDDPKFTTGFENGLALYKDLGGAGGHGGRDICNVINTNVDLIMHELGHAMEQEVRMTTDENLLDKWKNATEIDEWNVSPYGNQNAWEDMAEYGVVYSVAYQKNILDELKVLSPNRYAIWTECICLLNNTLRTPRCNQYLDETDRVPQKWLQISGDTVTQNLVRIKCIDEADRIVGTAGGTKNSDSDSETPPDEYEPDTIRDSDSDSDSDSDNDSDSDSDTTILWLLTILLISLYVIFRRKRRYE